MRASYTTLAVCLVLGAAAFLVLRGTFTNVPPAPPRADGGKGGDAGPQESREADHPAQGEAAEMRVVPDGRIPAGTSGLVLTVLDGEGRPIIGAAVTLHDEAGSTGGATDGRGEVIFSGIREGAFRLRLVARPRPELASAGEILLEPDKTRRIAVRLGDFDLSLAGRTRSIGGTPIAGIPVEASPLPFDEEEIPMVPADRSSRRAVSDDQGFFAIGGLEDRDHELRTVATGTYPPVKKVVPAGLDSVDLILEEGQTVSIRGRVTGEDGRALDGVRVFQLERPHQETRTRSDGSYSLDLFLGRKRTCHLVFHREGYRESQFAMQRDEAKEAAGWDLDVKLELAGGPAVVTGAILTSAGLPVAGESVHLQSRSLGTSLAAVSDARGRFSFPEAPLAGDYRIRVRPRGWFKDFLSSQFALTEEGFDLEVTLEPLGAGEIHGQIVDANGHPVPRFKLWLTSTEAAGRSLEIVGDAEGRFGLEDVPAGELVIQTRSDPRFAMRGVELVNGSAMELRIVLDRGPHEIGGIVVDPSGSPLPGVLVEMSWHRSEGRLRSSSRRRIATDDAGRFQFVGVGPGPHRLALSARGYTRVELDCEAGSGIPLWPITMVRPGEP